MTLQQVWTQKYKPSSIDEMLLGDNEKLYFSSLTEIPNNLLLTGTPGSGKTTMAKLLAEKFSPFSYMYINASEQGTIDVLREKIAGFIEVISIDGNPKVVILDEIDGSSNTFQQALRVILEEHLDDVKFILTANYRNKILPALKSRCAEHQFSCSEKQVLTRIVHILKTENITIGKDQVENLRKLIKTYFPDVRKTINELQRNCIGREFIYTVKNDTSVAETVKFKLKNKEEVFGIRQYIIDNTDKFGNDYHSLMRSLFDLYVKESNVVATLLISEYMYRHTFVLDTEINFSALLFNLSQKI